MAGASAGPSVLAVTPVYMDQLALRIASSRRHWNLRISPTLESAVQIRRRFPVSVIVYDMEGRHPDWRYAVRELLTCGTPACLIALTDFPSDAVWRKLLDYGGYDLQLKPLRKNAGLPNSVDAAHRLMRSIGLASLELHRH